MSAVDSPRELPYASVDILNGIEIKIGEGWIKFSYPLAKGIERIEISCAWIESNPADRIGIWVGLSDERVPQTLTAWGNGHAIGLESYGENSPIVDVERWEFGKSAKLIVETKQQEMKLNVYLLCRPRLDDLKRSLEITIDEYSAINGMKPENSETRVYEFQRAEKSPMMRTTISKLEELGSLNYTGIGNVIHPKQILTLKALQHLLRKKMLNDEKSFSVAYVGTDTLENLTSIIRWLESKGLYGQITEIKAYTYDDWDDKLQDLLDDLVPVNIGNDSKVDLVPNNESQRADASSHDVVITTYVCPWIKKDDRDDFQALIDKLVGPNSVLISVDPKTALNSVRSPIFNSNEYNPQSIYKGEDGLELSNLKTFKFHAAEAIIYKRKKGWVMR